MLNDSFTGDIPVELCVHRAAHAIGGNCIEIRLGERRLLLDAGLPLDDEMAKQSPLPKSLDTSIPVDGVLLSHLHGDHAGAVSMLPREWDLYCGEATAAILKVLATFGGKKLENPIYGWKSGIPFSIGPFRVTPRLVDHSAFDAALLEICVEDKKIIYSGDFRMHGRKEGVMRQLLAKPPQDVDVLILEGTNLFTLDQPAKSLERERDLEIEFVQLFKKTKGRVFVSWAATNVDRTVTLYRACKRTGRRLVVDAYTMRILHTVSSFYRGIPSFDWEGADKVLTVATGSMNKVLEMIDGDSDFMNVLTENRAAIKIDRLKSNPDNWVVMARSSLVRDYARRGLVAEPDDKWVWSQWRGYLGQDSTKVMCKYFAPCGGPVHLHTSGHASAADLQAFAEAINPKMLVPVHGENWDEWSGRFPNCRPVTDGEWLEV